MQFQKGSKNSLRQGEALESECVDIEGDKTTFQIDNLEMNELHAISVFHDENFNGNLDMKKS